MRKYPFTRFVWLLLTILICVGYADADQAKYVFLMIGDGMGAAQRSAAEQFSQSIGQGPLTMNSLPAQGLTTTHSYDSPVTDSAAAATAIACGRKTANGVVSLDHTRQTKLKTLAEIAAQRGMKVGIISSVSINHATPACFYAHQPSRGNYYQIAVELAQSNFEYFAGGSVQGATSEGQPSPFDLARQNGFTIVTTRPELMALQSGSGKVWTYNHTTDHNAALFYEIDRPADHISLAEFTRKGIDLLANPDGFFMMVEGGKIDWACHAHDAAAAIHDTIAFDDAVAEALKFYKQHPTETLIVVTADHETGGMGLSSAVEGLSFSPRVISRQTISGQQFVRTYLSQFKQDKLSFAQALPTICSLFGLSNLSAKELADLRQAYAQGELAPPVPLQIVSTRAGIVWSTGGHTATPVPTSAIGVGAKSFQGSYDNTDIFKKIDSVMKSADAVDCDCALPAGTSP